MVSSIYLKLNLVMQVKFHKGNKNRHLHENSARDSLSAEYFNQAKKKKKKELLWMLR